MAKEKNINLYGNNQSSYIIRTETFEGKEYTIVPVVMMTEGVHNGSHGRLLHTKEELNKFTDAWNGIPVTVQHPNVDGYNVSANSPEVLEMFKTGMIFNTVIEDDKLKGEAWIDTDKLETLSVTALQAIQNNKPLNVSVGVFNDTLNESGKWGNEKYVAIATNYRPDHLALLPGEVGACSWEDGCGIRLNQKNKDTMKKEIKAGKDAATKGLLVANTFFRDVAGKVRRETWYFLEELFDNYFIYRKSGSDGEKFFKQMYSITSNNDIQFIGESVEMKQKDVKVSNNISNNLNIKGKIMSDKTNPCCPEKVTKLINHQLTTLQESDREWLNELEEDQITRMTPKEVQVNADQVTDEMINQRIGTYLKEKDGKDKVLEMMPKEFAESVKTGLNAYAEKRKALKTQITNNSEKDTWSDEELDAMDITVMEKIAKTISKANLENQPADYSGQAGVAAPNNNEEGEAEMLLPINMLAENEKETKK